MITNYHRPNTFEEALRLLDQPNTVPLGGGTLLSHTSLESISVVDLQSLNLNLIQLKGNNLEIGSTVKLQEFLESDACHEAIRSAIKLEAPPNLRNSATVGGTLVASDGRSPLANILLALDAKIEIRVSSHDKQSINLGEYLPLRRRGLITQITIPANPKLAFQKVARTPADKPIICASLAQWGKGRTRLVVGGWGKSPTLAMDGTEPDGLETAARNACHESTDEWASADYRMDVAATLAKRCLQALE